jgi:hypothetical protein
MVMVCRDRWFCWLGCLGMGLVAWTRPCPAVDFSHEVVPILRQHCAECHTAGNKKGGFSINDRQQLLAGGESGPAIQLGASHQSYLIELVTSSDPEYRMPPTGERLSPAEVDTLRRWIDEGLVWESGFAFEVSAYDPPVAPRRPDLPPPTDGRTHPIDRIIDAYLADHSLAIPPALDDQAFLRRSSLDLIGLLPEPAEVQAFLDDPRPDKRQRWLESRLADDVAYADHWLTFWNDLLRNDYSGTGFITGGRSQISRWLYQSLVDNKAFDRFTRELIAPESDDCRGFIDGIRWRGDVSAGQTVEIQFAQSVSQSFLGINMKCASCHDSFIDRWKLSEAYGLASIYAPKPLEIYRCDKATGQAAKPSWLFPELGQVDPEASPPERLKQLAELMTSPRNGRFARTIVNRLWYQLMGRGIVHPVDSMQSPPWNADLLDHLATELVDLDYDLRKLLLHIASSSAYQSQAEIVQGAPDEGDYRYRGPRAKRLTAEQFVDAVWTLTEAGPKAYDAPVFRGRVDAERVAQLRPAAEWIWADSKPASAVGDPAKAEGAKAARKGKEAKAKARQAKDKDPPVEAKRDETEAKAKPTEDNKLTGPVLFQKDFQLDQPVAIAGVMLTANREYTLFVNNRYIAKQADWQTLEMYPVHQWLRQGRNTLAVLASGPTNNPESGTLYVEAKIGLTDGQEVTIRSDASWKYTREVPSANEKRLKAIDAKSLAGVSVKPASAAMKKILAAQGAMLLARATTRDTHMVRASLMKSDFMMRTLGRPNRDQIVSMRPSELTTLEAIDLSNGQAFADLLAAGAKRWMAAYGDDSKQLVEGLYQRLFTRSPTDAELSEAQEVLGDTISPAAVADLCWVLLMSPEFHYIR